MCRLRLAGEGKVSIGSPQIPDRLVTAWAALDHVRIYLAGVRIDLLEELIAFFTALNEDLVARVAAAQLGRADIPVEDVGVEPLDRNLGY